MSLLPVARAYLCPYTLGHPEYGQLGNKSDGRFIKDGGKGAAIQFNHITRPQLLSEYVSKNAKGQTTATLLAETVRIRAVAAGKNHSLLLEDWEGEGAPSNRIFSCGFGG